MMHDPAKLPVEMWAEKSGGRTRIIMRVGDDDPVEVFSWPDGYDKLGLKSDPVMPVTVRDFLPPTN